MRAHGWSWAELQQTPENVLAYLAMIESWSSLRARKDGELRGDPT